MYLQTAAAAPQAVLTHNRMHVGVVTKPASAIGKPALLNQALSKTSAQIAYFTGVFIFLMSAM